MGRNKPKQANKSSKKQQDVEKDIELYNKAKDIIDFYKANFSNIPADIIAGKEIPLIDTGEIESVINKIGNKKKGDLAKVKSELKEILYKYLPAAKMQYKFGQRILNGLGEGIANEGMNEEIRKINSDNKRKKISPLDFSPSDFIKKLQGADETQTQDAENSEEYDLQNDEDEGERASIESQISRKTAPEQPLSLEEAASLFETPTEQILTQPEPTQEEQPELTQEEQPEPTQEEQPEPTQITNAEAGKLVVRAVDDFITKRIPLTEALSQLTEIIPVLTPEQYDQAEDMLVDSLFRSTDEDGNKLFKDEGQVRNFLRQLRSKNKTRYKLPVKLNNNIQRERNLYNLQLNPMLTRNRRPNVSAIHFYNE